MCVKKTVTSCTDHKWVDCSELLTWCFIVTARVLRTVRPRYELSLDTLFRLKLRRFFFVQLQHFINTIWNGICICHWQCCLISSSSSLSLSSSSWPLYVLEFCFKILRCYFTSPLKVFPFMKEMVSIYCVNTGVILNVSLSPYWMKFHLQTTEAGQLPFFVFVTNSKFVQNFQLMPWHIAFEVLSKLRVRLQLCCSDPFICIVRMGDTWFFYFACSEASVCSDDGDVWLYHDI
jgi:hypothetical protein